MPKFEDRFLSVQSLARKYDCSVKTIRRFLKDARVVGIEIGQRKIMGAIRYSENDFDKAMEKAGKQGKLKMD